MKSTARTATFSCGLAGTTIVAAAQNAAGLTVTYASLDAVSTTTKNLAQMSLYANASAVGVSPVVGSMTLLVTKFSPTPTGNLTAIMPYPVTIPAGYSLNCQSIPGGSG